MVCMRVRGFIAFLLLLPCLWLVPASCQKEVGNVGSVEGLALSCDTLAFDTVFTQMGTTTKQFKIYNRGTEGVTLEEVTLAGGRASRFRLNVDGDTSMVARAIEIAAGDSVFVFVRANIKPNLSTEPFLIEDAVVMRGTGGELRLPLTAYGRNAIYHVPTDTISYADGTPLIDMFGRPYAYSVIDCDNWRHDLPHVVVGYAVVDSRCTLRLEEGDELYFCDDAVLWVYDSATLVAMGSDERPVLFTSVRHDGRYDQLPGQWGYVWLSAGSKDNVMDRVRVENAYVGILADSCVGGSPTLSISNSQICNHTLAGLLGQTARMEGYNLLVSNCGTATVVMQYGGDYTFGQCTFADYWRYGTRTNPSVLVTNTREYEGALYVWPMRAHMHDCIIYGSRPEGELLVDLNDYAAIDTLFRHCLVRGGAWDEDPLFVAPQSGNYRLREGSPAMGMGYSFGER